MKPYTLYHGDCLAVLRTLPDNSVDAVVTDPPYGLSFMGKRWDYDVPAVDVWAECLRVLKPGGHLLAFAGTRTQHRMAVRIEDAGFEIRDMIAWVYGSGFPKSHDVSKAIDKLAGRIGYATESIKDILRKAHQGSGRTLRQLNEVCGFEASGYLRDSSTWASVLPPQDKWHVIRDALDLPTELDSLFAEAEREVIGYQKRGNSVNTDFMSGGNDITAPATDAAKQWEGWGTALKPALEPITVARKPLDGTVAENVLAHGTGALNVDGCRVGTEQTVTQMHANSSDAFDVGRSRPTCGTKANPPGRWPANLIHDGSEEVVGLFPETGASRRNAESDGRECAFYQAGSERSGGISGRHDPLNSHDDAGGSAARFFYCAKAAGDDRDAGAMGLFWRAASTSSGWEQIAEALYWALWNENEAARKAKQRPPHVISHGNLHPTVKPTDLMRYLCRLVTPPNGVVLDPFTGSGSTGRGAILEGFRFIGIEREADYLTIARARIDDAVAMRASETSQLTML